MQTTIRALIAAGMVVAAFGAAMAKLPPAPPQTEEQKAAAAAKAKAAAEKDAAELTKAQDRAVANYVSEEKAKGKTPHAAMPEAKPAEKAPAKK